MKGIVSGCTLWAFTLRKFYIFLFLLPLPGMAQVNILHEFNTINAPYEIYPIVDDAYFKLGSELWKTDGSEQGTSKVIDLEDPYISTMTLFNGDLYYVSSGLNKIYKVNVSVPSRELIFEGYVDRLYHDDSYLYFVNSEQNGNQRIFKSDGTPSGTTPLEIDLGSMISFGYPNIASVLPFQHKLLVVVNTDYLDQEVWFTDGTPAGTERILDDGNGFGQLHWYSSAILGSKLFFVAYDDVHGTELWVTDGTASGTHVFLDLSPGLIDNSIYPNSSSPSSLMQAGGQIFFTSHTDSKLWVTNGTPETTLPLVSNAETLIAITRLSRHDDKVFFNLNNPNFGIEPWVTDGTPAGTFVVKDIWNGVGSSMDQNDAVFYPANDFQFMAADDGTSGMELWGYDLGTGTVGRVVDFTAGAGSTHLQTVRQINNKLIFFILSNDYQHVSLASLALSSIALQEPEEPAAVVPNSFWTQFIGNNRSYVQTQLLFNYDMAISPHNEIVLSGVTDGRQTIFYQNNKVFSVSPEQNRSRNILTKFSPEGELLWHKQLNGTESYYRKNSALDVGPDGSTYFATSLYSGYDYGELDWIGDANGYLLKLDEEGNQQWIEPILTGEKLEISRIKSDVHGNVYLTGLYYGNIMSFESTIITSDRSPAYFLAKTNSNGELAWAVTLPDNWDYYGDITDLEIDEKNKHVLLLISDGLRNKSSTCEFKAWALRIVCLDFSGEIIWDQPVSCSDFMIGSSMSIGPGQDIFVVGRYRGTLTSGKYSIQSPKGNGCHLENSFLLKVNEEGEVWGLRTVGNEFTDTYEINFLKDGSYLLSGAEASTDQSREDGFPAPYPSHAYYTFLRRYDYLGNLLQKKTFNKNSSFQGYEFSNPIARVDHADNIILSDRVRGKFDTIRYSPDNLQLNLVLLKTTLGQFAAGYTAEDLSGNIQLFPNPVNDRLNLKIWREMFDDQNFTMTMYNSNGQLVGQEDLDPQQDIYIFNTLSLASGLYLVKLQNSQQMIVSKIVVLH